MAVRECEEQADLSSIDASNETRMIEQGVTHLKCVTPQSASEVYFDVIGNPVLASFRDNSLLVLRRDTGRLVWQK